jgi:glycerol-3-phosphate responsive antiterminator
MALTKELLMDSPVIAAVKEDTGLRQALNSDCQVIFLLFGTILNIGTLVEQVHARGKICFVHIDLIDGLSNREIAVDALVKLSNPDGIISTRAPQIRRAQQLGILAIQRVFLLDSMSLHNIITMMDTNRPDFIEILPGVIPTVIEEITAKTPIPVIAGGLIRSKQDVIQALQAGVMAVSTSCQAVWKM